jgi:hypothetical protein
MAKKKKRRHPQRPRPRPQTPGAAAPDPAAAAADARDAVAAESEPDHGTSRRAERKEDARRERERRMRQARRRQRTRRLLRWGIVLGLIVAIVVVVVVVRNQSQVDETALEAALQRLSCTDVEEQNAEQPNEHVEPYAHGENGVPAFGGNHVGTPLPQEPKVYTQQPPEEAAIHNLEHGYILIYYAAEGDNALDPTLVSALEDVANSETEVLMSPYADLAKPLYLVAWGARQSCDPPPDASAEDVTLVAEGFIEDWKDGKYAPEPAVP